jgi:hypothetical protein
MIRSSRTTRVAAALTGCAAMVAAITFSVVGAPAASAATAPSLTQDPAKAAASWLAGRLADASGKPANDGDHMVYPNSGGFFFDGLTADTVYALAAAQVGADKISAVMSYYQANIAAATSVNDTSGTPGPYDGSVAKAALAAIVAGRDPSHFGGYDLLQKLADDSCQSVSAPASQSDFSTPTCPGVGAGRNIFSSVSQSLILIALKRGNKPVTPAQSSYLLSLQCGDGGFTSGTSPTNCSSDVDATAYGVLALTALGGHPTELTKAKDWLLAQRKAGAYWVSQGGPNEDSTGLAVSALDALHVNVDAARHWLYDQQVIEGPTFGPTASRAALTFLGQFNPDDSIKATADGILGMIPGASLLTVDVTGAVAGLPVLPADGDRRFGSVKQGAKQSVAGTGFSVGEKVTAVLHSTPVTVGTATANSHGSVELSFTVPKSLATGGHTVTLTGASSGLVATTAFTVTAAAAAVSPTPSGGSAGTASATGTPAAGEPTLAATGVPLDRMAAAAVVAAGMLLAGAGMLMLGRRRTA